jgi:hypothetical protein
MRARLAGAAPGRLMSRMARWKIDSATAPMSGFAIDLFDLAGFMVIFRAGCPVRHARDGQLNNRRGHSAGKYTQ